MASVVINGDTSGSVSVTVPATAGSNTITLPAVTGTAVISGQNSAITAGTAVSASGTSVDFTSIPSWVKRITIMLDRISTSGTDNLLVQIGDSGGIEATSYTAYANLNTNTISSTAGFIQTFNMTAATTTTGYVVLTLLNTANRWISNGQNGRSSDSSMSISSGSKATSATLDRVRITTVGGTDTFDAGTINILYE